MASLDYKVIEQAARDMYGRALEKYPPDLVACIEEAHARETNEVAKKHFELMKKAIDEGKKRHIPVCQDTGMQSFYLRCGTELSLNGFKTEEAIREGVKRLTAETKYRATVVHSITRAKTGLQSGERHPAVYWEWIEGADYLEMIILSKGSGSENKSQLKMLVPADGVEGVKRFVLEVINQAGGQFCPPGVVGIGVGGSFDSVAHMAKQALLRPLDRRNPDPALAALEIELKDKINDLKIGPMGLGGDTTVFAVNIEHGLTHETQNPVAVSVQCWAHRKSGVRLHPDGRIEEIDYFGD